MIHRLQRIVQEVNRDWLEKLVAGLPEYRATANSPRSDNFGIACFVRKQGTADIELVRAVTILGLIEDSEHLIVFFLRNGVKLVIVTLCTTHC